MYLENTTLAPEGSWRKTKTECRLIWDIASTIAARRIGDMDDNHQFMREAENLLRLFIARTGHYPHNFEDVDEMFPGVIEHGIRIVAR